MRAGEQIAGRYRLDRRLGRGGMGEVWQAYDLSLGRHVAVKVLLEVEAEHEALQRFRREASIGARLQHPGITVVHDVGQHDGRLFLVMELLEGTDLAHLLARSTPGGLPIAEALDLGAQAAEALAAAHAREVVHRDLKPANLFLAADGRLKICDFGIAWTSEATEGLTVTGRPFGSPPYMAPEQWRGEHVTVRCDLYALGCVLYALLSGAPPFPSGEHPWALMRRHLEDVPPPVRSVRAGIPAGVEALVAELLAKDPDARPDAVAAGRRLREAAGTIGAGAGSGTYPGPDPGAASGPGHGTYPDRGPYPGAGPGAGTPADAALPTVTAMGAGPVPAAAPAPHPGVRAPAGRRGPRRRTLVVGGLVAISAALGGTQLVRELTGDDKLHAETWATFSGFTPAAYAVAFSPDGRTLATGSGANSIQLWDLATRSRTGSLTGSGPVDGSAVLTVAYAPDGKSFADAGSDGGVVLWNPAGHAVITGLSRDNEAACNTVAFAPDGRTLAAGHDDTGITLWDVTKRLLVTTLAGAHRDRVLSAVYSPDGKSLLSIDAGGTLVLWNIPSQAPYVVRTGSVGLRAEVSSVAFGPDGKLFASADGSVRLWTGVTRDQATVLTSKAGPVYALALSPDGKTLATGAENGTVELWDVGDRRVTVSLGGHTGLVRGMAFSPDGLMLATASADRTARVWKLSR
ncbi:WD40 repeat domain-containing serine/threonine protein kinase [Streptomyces sp. NPDC049040]|uniref:WD40 repeat domain-containing serine/threonine protein kinase n=1 Tax=Streptomyces sp. NPDC049040 TaxID=3365593 RepID=UPI00371D964E